MLWPLNPDRLSHRETVSDGQFDGAVASKKGNGGAQGSLRMVGNHSQSVKDKGA